MNLKNLNIVGLDGFEKLTILQVWMDLKKLSTKEMHDSKDRERAIHWTCPFVRLPGIYLYKVCLSSVCMFECIFKKHSVLSVAMICFDKVPNIS